MHARLFTVALDCSTGTAREPLSWQRPIAEVAGSRQQADVEGYYKSHMAARKEPAAHDRPALTGLHTHIHTHAFKNIRRSETPACNSTIPHASDGWPASASCNSATPEAASSCRWSGSMRAKHALRGGWPSAQHAAHSARTPPKSEPLARPPSPPCTAIARRLRDFAFIQNSVSTTGWTRHGGHRLSTPPSDRTLLTTTPPCRLQPAAAALRSDFPNAVPQGAAPRL